MLRYLANGPRQLSGRVPATWRPHWEFYAVLEGRCAPVFHDHDQPELQERTLWVFAPECRHGWTAEPARPYERVAFHWSSVPEPLETLVRARPDHCFALKLDDARIARLRAIATELEPHFQRPTVLSPLHFQARLIDLAVMILGGTEAAPPPDLSQLAVFKVESALSWYTEHLPRAPSVKEVAAAVNISQSHIRRLFWQVRKASPKSVFQETRLERAQEMMNRSASSLEEVARRCGFTSASHLCRDYKAHFGVSPAAWRKKDRAEFAAPVEKLPAARVAGPAAPARAQRAS
jgi:AraC family transcriptional regulator